MASEDFDGPNGLAFSPDERRLYVADTGIGHGGRSNLRAFDMRGDTLADGRVFAEDFAPGNSDGVRTGVDGDVWCSMGRADPKRTARDATNPAGG